MYETEDSMKKTTYIGKYLALFNKRILVRFEETYKLILLFRVNENFCLGKGGGGCSTPKNYRHDRSHIIVAT